MMRELLVIGEGILYQNPVPHVYSRQAFFPSVIQLDDGDLLATFCIGQAFEAPDLHTVVARSTDKGESWRIEGRIYPGTADRLTSDVCRLSHGRDGEIVAYMIRHDRSRVNEGLANPDNMGFVEIEQLLFRSHDGGRTWAGPEVIDPPLVGPSFEMTSPIVPLKNGRWLLPTSTWRGWDGYCPNGMKMVAFISDDEGQSWPSYTDVMSDPQQELIYWESKMIELQDGRILAAAWTFNEVTGKDLPISYVWSSAWDQPFSVPRSTGLIGQTLTMTQLDDGLILTVYRRVDQPGLWAALSELDGDEWHIMKQYPLWGSRQNGLTAHGESMVQNFAQLKFGAPSLCRLDDNHIFLAFWAIEDGIGQIRWIKIKV